jgi:hypothetical protein
MLVHCCNPSYWASEDKMIEVIGQSAKKQETLSEKQTKINRTGGVAEVVECLPSNPLHL